MNDLNRYWQEYERKCIPKDAPFGQAIDCKRSFYQGADVILYLLSQMDNHRATEAQKIVALEGWKKEVQDFRRMVNADMA